MSNSIRIEHGNCKGVKISNGFSFEGSRITTSSNRCVLFNVLLNKFHFNIQGMRCADFCCGSGIVGFELLSLGAVECVFVDCDKKKLEDVKLALDKLKFSGECMHAYLPLFYGNNCFDIIFFDPPYINDFAQKTLDMICNNNLLSDSGVLIFETKNKDFDFSKFNMLDVKNLSNKANFFFLSKK